MVVNDLAKQRARLGEFYLQYRTIVSGVADFFGTFDESLAEAILERGLPTKIYVGSSATGLLEQSGIDMTDVYQWMEVHPSLEAETLMLEWRSSYSQAVWKETNGSS